MNKLLELAERLADLQIKRARLREIEEGGLALGSHPAVRAKLPLYRKASKALSNEINNVLDQIAALPPAE